MNFDYSLLEITEKELCIDYSFLDITKKKKLNDFYNTNDNSFLIKIINDCNIFSLNKILNINLLESVKKYIFKYNNNNYSNIEDYNKNIEKFEVKIKNDIKNIKEILYDFVNFDENILTKINEYSLQYYWCLVFALQYYKEFQQRHLQSCLQHD